MDGSTDLRAQAVAALFEMFFERACLAEGLGAMESENQHLYGARIYSFPCA